MPSSGMLGRVDILKSYVLEENTSPSSGCSSLLIALNLMMEAIILFQKSFQTIPTGRSTTETCFEKIHLTNFFAIIGQNRGNVWEYIQFPTFCIIFNYTD
jgi:hypothetical protein